MLLLGRQTQSGFTPAKSSIQSHFVAPSSQGFGRPLGGITQGHDQVDKTHAPIAALHRPYLDFTSEREREMIDSFLGDLINCAQGPLFPYYECKL